MLIWHQQYLFFRRYGMHDTATLVLNSILIFVVLFYIYPLKFLFTLLLNVFFFFRDASEISAVMQRGQMETLMVIYSLGFLATFLVFFLLYRHAYRKREELALDELEILRTRSALQGHAIYMSVAVLSILITLVGGANYTAVAGWVYGLLGPAMAFHGTMTNKRLTRLKAALQPAHD